MWIGGSNILDNRELYFVHMYKGIYYFEDLVKKTML